MNNIHAYMNVCIRVAPALARTPIDAIGSPRMALTGRAARLFIGLQHRWTMRRIARFSDHRLQDIGFERAWDGSVIPTQR